MVIAKTKLLFLLLHRRLATTIPATADHRREEGGIPIGRPTYASGQTIGSKASAPEKLQKTSNLEEQGTPEIRQAGVPQWKQTMNRDHR